MKLLILQDFPEYFKILPWQTNNIFIIYFYLLENADFPCKINVFDYSASFGIYTENFHKTAYRCIMKPSMLVKMLVKLALIFHFTNLDICHFLMAEKKLHPPYI